MTTAPNPPVPDPAAYGAFVAWSADGLIDYPTIAEGDAERVCIRAAEARQLVWRAYLAGWRRSTSGAAEVAATDPR